MRPRTANAPIAMWAIAVVVIAGALAMPARDAAAQTFDCGLVAPAVPDQFPTWSDEAGWSDASWYSTIQPADIDGDRRAELVARTRDGIVASRFDRATGMWIALGPPQPIFADRYGWSARAQYSTIQLADIDGRPGAELMGRGSDGFYTFTWDGATGQWKQVGGVLEQLSDAWGYGVESGWSTIALVDIDGEPGAELFARRPGQFGGVDEWKWIGGKWVHIGGEGTGSDANGWGVPEHYATSRFADIDGKPGAEWVGRGTEGIETRTWNRDTNKWVPLNFSSLAKSWNTPDKYLTIQLADLDGDGRAELVGRGGAGIEQFEWNIERKQWDRLGVVGGIAWDDASGWQDPAYYSTIQFADVIGDKGEELIARGHYGLVIARYTAGGWTLPSTWRVPSMSDFAGWQLPEAYSTIQAASVAGDGKAEIVGRGHNGVQTWTYDKARGTFASSIERAFPEFTGDELQAYQWISRNRFAEKRTDDIRAQYDNTTYTSAYWISAAQWLHDNGAQPPPGLSLQDPGAWTRVARQLEAEFSYVEALYTWFGNVDDFLGQVFDQKILSVESVARAINIPSEDRNEAIFDTLGMILAFGAALGGLAGEEGEIAAVAMHVAHLAMEASELAAGKPPDIQAEIWELEDELQTWNTRARNATACLRNAFLEHWGLMKAMGEPIVANELTWPSTLTRSLASRARKEYELELWKSLTANKWTAVASVNRDTKDPCTGLSDPPAALFGGYPTSPDGAVLVYSRPSWAHWYGQDWGAALFIVDRNCGQAPPQEALRHLFSQSAPDGTGPLGVPFEDPHCANDGWRIAGSGRINPFCEHPWGSETHEGAAVARAAQAGLGARAIREAREHLAALRARGGTRAHLRHASSLLEKAQRLGGPFYVGLADDALAGVADRIRPRSLARRVHEIRELLIGHEGDPPRVQIAGAAAPVDGGAASIRVRCPAHATRECTGSLRLLQRERTIGRGQFSLSPGDARTLRVRLSRAALGRRVTVRATTTLVSGARTVAARRIRLQEPPTGTCSGSAC